MHMALLLFVTLHKILAGAYYIIMSAPVDQISVVLLETFHVFVNEVITVNWKYYSVILEVSLESIVRWAAFVILTVLIVLATSYILVNPNSSKSMLKWWPCFSIPSLLLLPVLIPSKAFSFFMGVSNFGYCMTIYNECYSLLEGKEKAGKRSLFTQFLCIVLFNVPLKVLPKEKRKDSWPTFMQFIHGFILLGIADILNFLAREWIPYHISPRNRTIALSMIGAMWTLCALEYAYWFAGTASLVLGAPMSNTMYHHNPILSLSLKEFWGLRWNPILGKQLSDSFYKPVRAMGLSRPFAVLSCFTGSALLHAIPKIISEVHWEETGMMFFFFFVQGVLVLMEGYVGEVYEKAVRKHKLPLPVFAIENHEDQHVSIASAKNENGAVQPTTQPVVDKKKKKGGKKNKKVAVNKTEDNDDEVKKIIVLKPKYVKYGSNSGSLSLEEHLTLGRSRFVFELIVVATIVSSVYHTLEIGWSKASILFHVLLTFCIVYTIVQMRLRLPVEQNEYSKRPAITVVFIILRWFTTLFCILPVMPFFNLPMMSAVEQYSSCSLLFAPLLRALNKKFDYFAGHV